MTYQIILWNLIDEFDLWYETIRFDLVMIWLLELSLLQINKPED
jgi:hypothetical protein